MITLRILRWGLYGGVFALVASVAGIAAIAALWVEDCGLCPIFGVIIGGPLGFFIGIGIGLIVEGRKPGFRQNIDAIFYVTMASIFTAFCVCAYIAVAVAVDIWGYYSRTAFLALHP